MAAETTSARMPASRRREPRRRPTAGRRRPGVPMDRLTLPRGQERQPVHVRGQRLPAPRIGVADPRDGRRVPRRARRRSADDAVVAGRLDRRPAVAGGPGPGRRRGRSK